MNEQFKIGWTAFIQGFHSSHWMITQNEHCRQQKVQDSYDKPRTFLTPKEKKLFTLPVTQRLKTGTYRLKLWLDMVDHIYFDNKQQRTEET